MSVYKEIRKEAYTYVLDLFTKDVQPGLLYHSFSHTEDTVKECKKILESEPGVDVDHDLILIAALFHDTGYLEKYEGHEDASCQIAEKFLHEKGMSEENIAIVRDLIVSTRSGAVPCNKAQQVLHDADYANITRKDFFEKGNLLRREWELKLNRTYTDLEWERLQLEFLETHRFYTVFGQKKLEPGKASNIIRVKEMMSKIESKEERKHASKRPSRGIETMYRSIYRNHIGLSAIADRKANMMISINTIIISVIMSFIGSGYTFARARYMEDMRFTVPLILLLLTSLVSVIFAILSARPNLREKKDDSKESVLFFGTFSKMEVEHFIHGMNELMSVPGNLYESMTVDIYNLGAVLQRKYGLLRISYGTFLIGLVVTVVCFLIILGVSSYSTTAPAV